nr:MAG TPA: hypothetical protein [Caudoviricetes sp.]
MAELRSCQCEARAACANTGRTDRTACRTNNGLTNE